MDFDKAYDKLDWVRGQLESTVSNSRVDLMPSDTGSFFITVTQRNGTTGNDSTWSFCVNVNDNYVQMLEPTEDKEKFTNITEVYSIIKSFLQGGMSREKRRNMPEYNPGEPIKITGKGNKIGSAKEPIKSSKDPYAYAEAMDKVYKYAGKEITNQPIEIIKILDNGKRSGFLTFIFKSGNNTYQMTYDYGFGGEKSGAVIKKVVGGKIESSHKPIKSDWNKVDKKTLTNPEYPEYKIVKHEWVNFRDIAYEWTIYKNNEPLYWKKVRGQDKYVNIPEQEYKNNYNAISGFKSLQKAISVLENYIQDEKGQTIESSCRPIKSSLSDVNKALGFTDNDIGEDGKIHITTDLGEFVVDYVNDSYIVSYDGEERIFTEYKDTVEEVVNLFNTLCNEEVEFFDKNINSSKSIKSGYVIKVTETDNDNTYSPTYVNGDSWQSKEPQIFETEEDAQEQAEDFRKYLNKRVRSLGGRWQYKLEIVKSSRKPIKSANILKEHPSYELKGKSPDGRYGVYRDKKNGMWYLMDEFLGGYEDKASEKDEYYFQLNVKDWIDGYDVELENPEQYTVEKEGPFNKCIGFNRDTDITLWKGKDGIYTLDYGSFLKTKRKDIADKWIEKYNLDTTDEKRLNQLTKEGIGLVPWGLPLVEDKDQTNWNKRLADIILPPHNLDSSLNKINPETIKSSRKSIKSSFTQDELDCLREMIVDGMDERFYDWYSEKYGSEPWNATNEQMAEWIKSDPEITKEYNDYLEREMPYYEPGHDEKYINEFLKSSNQPIKSSTEHINEYIASDSFAESGAFQDYIMDKLSEKGFSPEEIEYGWYDSPVKEAREDIEKNYSIDNYVNWAKDYITKDKYKMMWYKDWLMANGYPVEEEPLMKQYSFDPANNTWPGPSHQ